MTASITRNWSAEQKKAFASLKRSRAWDIVEEMVNEYACTGHMTFEDVWYSVTYETDYAEDEPETYWAMPEEQRLTPRSYRYAKQWSDRTKCLCRE